MSWQNRWEPRSSSQLQGQKTLSEGRVRRIHTYTHFSSFHGRLSPQISFCDPHPTVFLSLSFFLWIQTGFEAKAAVDPSRFVNLPTNLPASTSNFTITFKKNIHRYTAWIAQRSSCTSFTSVRFRKRSGTNTRHQITIWLQLTHTT